MSLRLFWGRAICILPIFALPFILGFLFLTSIGYEFNNNDFVNIRHYVSFRTILYLFPSELLSFWLLYNLILPEIPYAIYYDYAKHGKKHAYYEDKIAKRALMLAAIGIISILSISIHSFLIRVPVDEVISYLPMMLSQGFILFAPCAYIVRGDLGKVNEKLLRGSNLLIVPRKMNYGVFLIDRILTKKDIPQTGNSVASYIAVTILVSFVPFLIDTLIRGLLGSGKIGSVVGINDLYLIPALFGLTEFLSMLLSYERYLEFFCVRFSICILFVFTLISFSLFSFGCYEPNYESLDDGTVFAQALGFTIMTAIVIARMKSIKASLNLS